MSVSQEDSSNRLSQVESIATELKSSQDPIQRGSESHADESGNNHNMQDSSLNQPENINIEHQTNEGPMHRKPSIVDTEHGLRSRRGRGLLVLVALFLRAYKASLSASFGVYYMQFLLYFNVISGAASWIEDPGTSIFSDSW